MQQKTLISWLKAIVVLFALLLAVLLFLIVPTMGWQATLRAPQASFLFWPCLIFIWVLGSPVYLMLIEAWKVCGRIASGRPFCAGNARSFVAIGQYSLLDCGLLFAGNAALAAVNALQKLHIYPAGIPLFSLLLIFIGLAVSVAAATLSHLIYKACEINEENQLTI